jgi:hypothetical protein
MVLSKTAIPRRLFMILSPRSFPYAKHGLKSLLTNALKQLHLHLVTDTNSNKQVLIEETASYPFANRQLVWAATAMRVGGGYRL